MENEKKNLRALFTLVLVMAATSGVCQETVFGLFKSEVKLADQYFRKRNFQRALSLYQHLEKKDPDIKDITAKVARCHFFLKQYDAAIAVYDKSVGDDKALSPVDIFYYAESQAAAGRYGKAIESFRKFLVHVPDDELTLKKIWRLTNIHFLYEDSLHYAVRPVSLNTEYGELGAVPFRKGLVFISNRKEVQIIEKMDGALNAPFYKVYYSPVSADTNEVRIVTVSYGRPVSFSKELGTTFHAGPVSFYDDWHKMVFASSVSGVRTGERTLQLYFAALQNGIWKVTHTFPFNSTQHSISDPAISEDGTILYFSSDMRGGRGGKDLYRSDFKNGQWTRPVNLGETVNTAYDEVSPYVHRDQTLYFSSNGHAGLGGLDIFKSEIINDTFEEPQNVGYPLNTKSDEFGMVIDSLDTHGYFSSNRKQGGYNDDIYEFDMDLQTYPLVITGLVRFKEHSWSDSSELKSMADARISVIDNLRNITVYETQSDSSGNFSITIPHFSQYKIRVIGQDHDENIVSFELPKHRKLDSVHEIVVIKDAFKPSENQE